MKDRQMLVAYRGKVEPGSAPERKIDDLLNNQVKAEENQHLHSHQQVQPNVFLLFQQIRWKN